MFPAMSPFEVILPGTGFPSLQACTSHSLIDGLEMKPASRKFLAYIRRYPGGLGGNHSSAVLTTAMLF